MGFSVVVAESLAECWTATELRDSLKVITQAYMADKALTGNQMEGVAFQFAPKTPPELEDMMVNVKGALDILEPAQDVVQGVLGRSFDRSFREIL